MVHHGLRLLGGARLHDAQQEAHEHGLHHVHLALQQGRVLVRWQPSIPLRPPPTPTPPCSWAPGGPLRHGEAIPGSDGDTGKAAAPQPLWALHRLFPWPRTSPSLDLF